MVTAVESKTSVSLLKVIGEQAWSANIYCVGREHLAASGFKPQFLEIIDILETLLEEAHFVLTDVVQVTIYLASFTRDFPEMNELFAEVFGNIKPARTCIGVSELPFGVCVGIQIVAMRGNHH